MPDPLNDEINEFLERAQRRRAARGGAAPPPPPPPPPPRPRALVDDEPIEAEIIEPTGASPLSASPFGRVGSQDLGREVAQSDDRLEQRLHDTFDHRLGTLAGRGGSIDASPSASAPAVTTQPIAPGAAELAVLLTHPASLRQAILVSEILHRPEHRW